MPLVERLCPESICSICCQGQMVLVPSHLHTQSPGFKLCTHLSNAYTNSILSLALQAVKSHMIIDLHAYDVAQGTNGPEGCLCSDCGHLY